MRKVILLIAALLPLLAACHKPYETSIDLGVNNERIDLPSFEEGHCFITVFSNGSWNIEIAPAVDWARLDRASGEGIGYVRFDYDENLSGDERSATVLVTGQGKSCEITVNQPKEE